MPAHLTDIYNRCGHGDLSGFSGAPIDQPVTAPPSFNSTILDEGRMILIPSQNEMVTGQIGTIDTQVAQSMNTAAEPAQQSSDSEDGVDLAVLDHISSYVNTTPSTPLPARASPRGHRRKVSDQSNLSDGQKKPRVDNMAEGRRIAAKREAAEPPLSEK